MLDQLTDLLETVSAYARETPFAMYACSVSPENNFMLTRHGDQRFCSIRRYAVNSIATDHTTLCAETEKWVNDLIRKSIPISGESSGRERFRFFRSLKIKSTD